MTARWDYQVIEEPNPVALQERLASEARGGWEAVSLGYAGECRLLAVVRRRVPRDRGVSTSGQDPAEAKPGSVLSTGG